MAWVVPRDGAGALCRVDLCVVPNSFISSSNVDFCNKIAMSPPLSVPLAPPLLPFFMCSSPGVGGGGTGAVIFVDVIIMVVVVAVFVVAALLC